MKLETQPGPDLQGLINHSKNHRFYSKVDGKPLLGLEQGNVLILFKFQSITLAML